MCGIAGVIGYPLTVTHLEALRTLFHLTDLRGGDGVGAFCVSANQSGIKTQLPVKVFKDHSTTADWAYADEEFRGVVEHNYAKRAVVLHCRSATVGKVTKENNHPIECENTIGVHNGTLKGLRWNSNPEKTDSQLLYEAIDSAGFSEVYSELKDEPYALVWLDKVSKTLNFSRSKERPMAFMKLDSDCLFFASDYRMLKFTADYHNLTVTKNGLFELSPNTLVSFDMNKHTVTTPSYAGPVLKEVVEEKKLVG